MVTRREFLKVTGLTTGGFFLASCAGIFDASSPAGSWYMPDEAEPHRRTWMAFGASVEIWGEELLPVVQQNLADIALAISVFEPVTMLVRESELELARELMGDEVEFVVAEMDDFWMRDTGPVFVKNEQGDLAGINFNFNGWGEKQEYAQDAKVAEKVAGEAKAEVLSTSLVLEGGGIEVDGHGTAIITESCVLNPNRNPNVSKEECEAELKRLLGLEKIIWLPGVAGKDITDGHTDFYARFVRPGVVVAGYEPDPNFFDHEVTKKHLEILEAATDAQGRALEVFVLESPSAIRPDFESDDFAAGYINFYVCNGGVIMPEFGDSEADAAARDTLQELFPEHEIVQLNIDGIAAGGGGIHCTTQQEPM
jgi:agmatine deiminase